MKLDFIATLANRRVRSRFLTMERSLRAVGCDLPLRVIPYDGDQFDLPDGAAWWEDEPLFGFLRDHGAHPTLRKYACLKQANYQFVDSDVVFVRNPAEVLLAHQGWITSCAAWRSPRHTLTSELDRVLRDQTTLTQLHLFNSGQFACDRALYDQATLEQVASDSRYAPTTLTFPYHEQPGVNLLVQLSGVPVTNITLPPHQMESTWAGDYRDAEYDRHWTSEARTPYLIHWAGCNDRTECPIDELYIRHFSVAERQQWLNEISARQQRDSTGLGFVRRHGFNLFSAAREFVSVLTTGKTRHQRQETD